MTTRNRVVITSFGSYGDVYPYIGLALELAARGHAPLLAMPAFYRDAAAAEGIDFHPVRPDIDPSDRETVRRIMNVRTGTRFIVRDVILPSLRETFEDLAAAAAGADLLVTHPITFAAPAVAEHLRIPWLSTVLAPMSFFSSHDLPVFPPMPWAKRLEVIPGAGSGLVWLARKTTAGWTAPVAELRRRLGLPPGGDPIYEGQHSPHGVLALFSRVLAAPQPDWPANVTITGAIRYNGRQSGMALPESLERFLASGPAPVVFTLGSSAVWTAGNFYDESVEAAGRLGMRAVLLVGSADANRPKGAIPESVILVDAAPHAALFPRASLVVHQGGAGTLHQGLVSGRPTLIVPFAHDQPDNAYRAQRLGVSRTLGPEKYAANRVAEELRRLMEDGSYRRRANDVSRQVSAEQGARVAADVVDEVLSRRVASR